MESNARIRKFFRRAAILCMAAFVAAAGGGCGSVTEKTVDNATGATGATSSATSMDEIPDYQDGQPMVVTINDGKTDFTSEERSKTRSYVQYNELDSLGRATGAEVILEASELPEKDRGSISSIHPTGWHSTDFQGLVPGGSFYNRAHLIAYSLTGIDGSSTFAPRDLVTATRTCNTEMIPYETKALEYLENNEGSHILYRVTPDFRGSDLVCRGIHMECCSIEDQGQLEFNVYIYNVQPGFSIDYSTGDMILTNEAYAREFTKTGDLQGAWEKTSGESGSSGSGSSGSAGSGSSDTASAGADSSGTADPEDYYIINTSSGVFHRPDCSGVKKMAEHNKRISRESPSQLEAEGYKPCGICRP